MKRLEKLLCCLLCVVLLIGWPAVMEEDVLERNTSDAIETAVDGALSDELLSDELLSDELLSDAAPEVGEILSLDEDEEEDEDSDEETMIPVQGDDTTVDGDGMPAYEDSVTGTEVMLDDTIIGADEMPDDSVTGTDETTEDDGVVTEGLSDNNDDMPAGDAAEVQEGEEGETVEDENSENAENTVTENAEDAEGDTVEDEEEPGLLTEMAEAAGDEISIDDTFKDDTLAGIVKSQFDKNGDGFLNTAEIVDAKVLNICYARVHDLNGIELLTELTYLDCSNLYGAPHILDISHCTKLTYLDCSGNHIHNLELSNLTNLAHLNCGSNAFETLDVSKNVKLTYLDCSSNYLKTLDVSRNTQLTTLNCSSNKLSTLNVSRHAKLQQLKCEANILLTLNLGKKAKLSTLLCARNLLTSLNISFCPRLSSAARCTPIDKDDYWSYTDNHYNRLDIDKNVRLVLPLEITKSCTRIVLKGDSFPIILKGKSIKSCKSSNKKIAKVTKSGLVTCSATRRGKATITITPKKGKKIKLKLIVADPHIPAKITITDESNQPVKYCEPAGTDGIKFQLGYVIDLPTAQGDARVVWSTSNPRVATIDQNGLVTPQGPGVVTITAYDFTGGVKATRKFTIIDPTMPTSISLTYNGVVKRPKDVIPGYTLPLPGQDSNTVQLGYAMQPAATAVSRVAWSSSDVRIATVAQNGVVTPLNPGTVTISVWALRAGKKASVKLRVTDPTVPTKVTINRPEGLVFKGERTKLTVTYETPGGTTPNPGRLIWRSSNKKIATVNGNGEVYFKKAGKKVTITVKASRGGKKASITLKAVNLVAPKSIRLQLQQGPSWQDLENGAELRCYTGDIIELQAIIGPDNAYGVVTWTSSDPSVATVENGMVYVNNKSNSSADITARTANGLVASVKIVVR